MLNSTASITRTGAAVIGLALSSCAVLAQDAPERWLERMANAVTSTNYQGTVIRRQRGESEALKVVHTVIEGVVNERLVSQEGNGLEIIRVGNEVHCILPDKKTVLVEGWNNQSTLFTALPHSEVVNTPQYDLSIIREGRIAGRKAVLLAVRPHDDYRYAHRIWLDEQSAFPLQTELLNQNGELVEEIKFADISISDDIEPAALDPSINLEGFTWYREQQRYETVDAATDWICDDLPAGFRVTSTKSEMPASGSDNAASTHIHYSDGVASVSVFISPGAGADKSGWAIVGTANSYTVERDGVEITAFGEVPGITVQRIASSMRRQ
jgi:sigma-E factor negative regulatory protein RseB